MTPDLITQARERIAILHASSAWGSDEDAILIEALVRRVEELETENGRLREANGILEDGLQEVGDDYPGSSCQEWCRHQIKQARAALGEGK